MLLSFRLRFFGLFEHWQKPVVSASPLCHADGLDEKIKFLIIYSLVAEPDHNWGLDGFHIRGNLNLRTAKGGG